MKKISDEELLDELRQRLLQTRNALTETKRLMKRLEEVNQKLEDSEQLKTNFLSNIRNEINNPLSVILGLSQAITQAGSDAFDKVREFARTIYKESFCLDFQLQNIFISADIESGECQLTPDRIDLQALIEKSVELFRHRIDDKALTVRIKAGGDKTLNSGEHVVTDAEKLQLIVSNLLNNAIEFSDKGGTVTVKTEVNTDRFLLSFHNWGTLIDLPNKNQVFDRFTQLDSGTKKQHRGHGLGLSICKDLVDMMGGAISVESTQKQGTRIDVQIPFMETLRESDELTENGNEFLFTDGETF